MKNKKTPTPIEDLIVSIKQGFDDVNSKFDIINDQFQKTDNKINDFENKVDTVYHSVLKNGDAFTKLNRYVECEISAVRSHLMRVDKKLGLA